MQEKADAEAKELDPDSKKAAENLIHAGHQPGSKYGAIPNGTATAEGISLSCVNIFYCTFLHLQTNSLIFTFTRQY